MIQRSTIIPSDSISDRLDNILEKKKKKGILYMQEESRVTSYLTKINKEPSRMYN